jgi:hypothetical protein
VAQIAQAVKGTRPTVSQGLNILIEARIVKQEMVGCQNLYSLNPRGLDSLRTEIDGLDLAEKYGSKEPGIQTDSAPTRRCEMGLKLLDLRIRCPYRRSLQPPPSTLRNGPLRFVAAPIEDFTPRAGSCVKSRSAQTRAQSR